MAHPTYPILGGLAFCLACVAPPVAWADEGVAQYSGRRAEELAFSQQNWQGRSSRVRVAQNLAPSDDIETAARNNLKAELDRIRREPAGGGSASSFDPPMPVRKKTGIETASADSILQATHGSIHPADPEIDRLTGQLLVMSFHGSQPSDAGPKAIRSLLQSGLIAGALFSRENIQSKGQLKELMKFLWAGGAQHRPIFAVREIGGVSDALPPIKDFEQWPPERDVAAKGDPQYAYSTYRSLGSALATLGFNMNFGPVLAPAGSARDQASSFGSNPLQTGVFAKTFLLGHREENVIAVPVIDDSDHSVRALKTLLVADPNMPVAMSANGSAAPFSAYEGLVRGAKFCFIAPSRGSEGTGTANSFALGCDVVVLNGGTENPTSTRDDIALSLSQARQNGDLTIDNLTASAQRVTELRSAGGNSPAQAPRSQ